MIVWGDRTAVGQQPARSLECGSPAHTRTAAVVVWVAGVGLEVIVGGEVDSTGGGCPVGRFSGVLAGVAVGLPAGAFGGDRVGRRSGLRAWLAFLRGLGECVFELFDPVAGASQVGLLARDQGFDVDQLVRGVGVDPWAP